MRNLNVNVLSAADNASANGTQIDANQLVSASFHAVFSDSHAAGTFKLQASNDVAAIQYSSPSTFTVTNWADIPNQSASITSGSAALLTIANSCYRWLRAVYTNTANYTEVQTVATAADIAGSLNSTYFTLQSIHTGAPKSFYLWLDDGAGVDPALPGKTGIRVVYSDNASANTLATLIRAALNALTLDFVATGATNQVIITNVSAGAVTAAADGTAATGFAFAVSNAGVNPGTINTNLNALSV